VPVEIFVLKLVVTPLLIAAATLVVRRWGHGVGGWLAGFPLTSAPVSIFLAVEQGPDLRHRRRRARCSVDGDGGLLSSMAGRRDTSAGRQRAAGRSGGVRRLPGSAQCRSASLSAPFVLVGVALGLVAALVPTTKAAVSKVRPPAWDLPLRMASATAVVLLLTAAARHLGPMLSGLLSPIPVFLLVLAVFAQRSEGPAACVRVLRGGVMGSFAFAVFFLVVGALLGRAKTGATYALASFATLAVNGMILWVGRRVLG
jgi:hypothetical protein